MSVENKRAHESDECPHCQRLLEIAAIKLSLTGGNVALFVCPNSGLARAEIPTKKLRHQISELERMLKKLKCWVQQS